MELIDALEAHHLATPLLSARDVLLREPGGEAHLRLSTAGFDQAPVRDRRGGRVVGWVLTASIDTMKPIRHSYRPLEISRFAGSATSINDVLPHLAETGFCFTVGRTGLEGFITPTDLDRHAARSHFYLLVSAVEMQLSAIIRAHLPEQELVPRISDAPLHVTTDGQVETLRARYERARRKGKETHAVEYLYLNELIDILERTALAGVNALLLAQLRAVRDLRPTVMHPTRSLAAQGAVQLASVAKAAVSAKAALDGLLCASSAAKAVGTL